MDCEQEHIDLLLVYPRKLSIFVLVYNYKAVPAHATTTKTDRIRNHKYSGHSYTLHTLLTIKIEILGLMESQSVSE